MKIGFIGAGKMAEALLAALVRGSLAVPEDIVACEVRAERRREIAKRFKVRVTENPVDVLSDCDVVILAVKPQDLAEVLEPLKPLWRRRHLVLSLAAGRSLAWIQGRLGDQVRLVRVMPNLPLMAGEGMSVTCAGAAAMRGDEKKALRILGCAGKAISLPEKHFDVVTALSGSGPAFFAFYLQVLTKAATEIGLPSESANLLAVQTMLGAAKYLQETNASTKAFMQAVASPGGTTAAGLEVLEKSVLNQIAFETIKAATKRSAELGAS
jgi:pyrroline-5-carboxylate reductase